MSIQKQNYGENDNSYYARCRVAQNFNAEPREKTEINRESMVATVPHSINLEAAKRRLRAKGYNLTCLGSNSIGHYYKLNP